MNWAGLAATWSARAGGGAPRSTMRSPESRGERQDRRRACWRPCERPEQPALTAAPGARPAGSWSLRTSRMNRRRRLRCAAPDRRRRRRPPAPPAACPPAAAANLSSLLPPTRPARSRPANRGPRSAAQPKRPQRRAMRRSWVRTAAASTHTRPSPRPRARQPPRAEPPPPAFPPCLSLSHREAPRRRHQRGGQGLGGSLQGGAGARHRRAAQFCAAGGRVARWRLVLQHAPWAVRPDCCWRHRRQASARGGAHPGCRGLSRPPLPRSPPPPPAVALQAAGRQDPRVRLLSLCTTRRPAAWTTR